jgi:hypothetical protein
MPRLKAGLEFKVTIDAVQTRGLDQTASRTSKVVPQQGICGDDGECLGRSLASNAQQDFEVSVSLLEMHERAQRALHAVDGGLGIRPLIAELVALLCQLTERPGW